MLYVNYNSVKLEKIKVKIFISVWVMGLNNIQNILIQGIGVDCCGRELREILSWCMSYKVYITSHVSSCLGSVRRNRE